METGTRTNTYTVVDIRKVVDNFAADFSMMSQATGLRSRENIAKTVADLKVFAETGYLVDVKLILKDSSGQQIRAAVYKVSTDAAGWTNDRPGNNLWPQTPGGALMVIATLSPGWWELTEEQKQAFRSQYEFNSQWGQTQEDTSFSFMTADPDRKYASNSYGLERTTYS